VAGAAARHVVWGLAGSHSKSAAVQTKQFSYLFAIPPPLTRPTFHPCPPLLPAPSPAPAPCSDELQGAGHCTEADL
jgi:hypothetical protein